MKLWADEEILAAIRDWHRRYGRAPRKHEWDAYRRGRKLHPNAMTVKKRFGSWNAGLEAAGLVVNRPGGRHWSKEAMIAALRADAEARGRPPTAKEWKRAGPDHPSNACAYNVFGSWRKFMAAAGFKPRPIGRAPAC